jgi:hypothetical protein
MRNEVAVSELREPFDDLFIQSAIDRDGTARHMTDSAQEFNSLSPRKRDEKLKIAYRTRFLSLPSRVLFSRVLDCVSKKDSEATRLSRHLRLAFLIKFASVSTFVCLTACVPTPSMTVMKS